MLACMTSEDLWWREEGMVSPPFLLPHEGTNELSSVDGGSRKGRMVLEEIFTGLLQMIKK